MTSTALTAQTKLAQAQTAIDVTAVDDDPVARWQAQGILMEVLGCNAAEAGELLRLRSLIKRRKGVVAVEGLGNADAQIAG